MLSVVILVVAAFIVYHKTAPRTQMSVLAYSLSTLHFQVCT
jgi:hypothetical protein